MPLKKTTQATHARKRVFERYGKVLNEQQYKELCNILRKGGGTTLLKQSNTRSIKCLNYSGIDFYVVYDRLRHQIATFLTKEMAEETVSQFDFNEERTMASCLS